MKALIQKCPVRIKVMVTVLCVGILIASIPAAAQWYNGARAYYDTSCFSKVFGHEKIYRIYLPEDYRTSNRSYPVIYYFHGWGGRYYKDDNANLNYEKIKEAIDKYKVILVMADGNIDTLEPRPYNVGYHNDVKFTVQMKDYFPELISHIDSTCRTIPDREHRGIIGFSMGGFMAFYLAGKYPDKVCAAVSFAGSPEFFVGYPSNHTLYPNRYTFQNLRQVNLALRNGSEDILYYLNEEVHSGALWDENVQMRYLPFKGPHMIDEKGETKVYEDAVRFVAHTFDSLALLPAAMPQNWSHYDLYNTFSVWGYQVASNKAGPGFLFLRNVDSGGFGFYTQRWLPDGPPITNLQADISTAPIYTPARNYTLLDYNKDNDKIVFSEVRADANGVINLHLDSSNHETGIFSPGDKPSFIFLDYAIASEQDAAKSQYLKNIPANLLGVRVLNRGGEINTAADLKVKITTADPSVQLADSIVTVQALPGQRVISLPAVTITCTKKPPPHAEPAAVRFHLDITYAGTKNHDEFVAPVFFNAPAFHHIQVDDGTLVRDSAYGKGNGNGIINAGERIMLYQDTNRLRLYTEDPFVIGREEWLADEIIPARWPDGYTFSSVIRVSPGCPVGHEIEFLASYETKTFNPIERNVHYGRVTIRVE